MLAETVADSDFFCWSDGMVTAHGLKNLLGNPEPEYFEFQRAMTIGGVMHLEEAEKRPDWALGPRWPNADSPIDTWGSGERWGRYSYGVGYEKDGDVWQLPHVGPGGKFRIVPVA